MTKKSAAKKPAKKAPKKKAAPEKKRPRLDYVQNALRVVRQITDGESKL